VGSKKVPRRRLDSADRPASRSRPLTEAMSLGEDAIDDVRRHACCGSQCRTGSHLCD
jgi:hypothetical protein